MTYWCTELGPQKSKKEGGPIKFWRNEVITAMTSKGLTEEDLKDRTKWISEFQTRCELHE